MLSINLDQETESYLIKNSFFVRNNNLLRKVDFCKRQWIQSEGNYAIIHTKEKKYAIKISLTKIIQRLPRDQFLRIHQRYIVRADLIESIDMFENTIHFETQSFPLGRTYKEVILNRLNKL